MRLALDSTETAFYDRRKAMFVVIDEFLFSSALEVLGLGLVMYFWGTDKNEAPGASQRSLGSSRFVRNAGIFYTALAGVLGLLFLLQVFGIFVAPGSTPNAGQGALGEFVVDSTFLGLMLSGLIALFVSFLVQWLQARYREIVERKKLATLLGYEVMSVKRLAAQFLPKWEGRLASYLKNLEGFDAGLDPSGNKDGIFVTWIIGDLEFPRAIYDKPTTNLALLPSELAATLAELYRNLEYSSRFKKAEKDSVLRYRELTGKAGKVPDDAPSRKQALIRAKQIGTALSSYVDSLKPIIALSEFTLRGLSRIAEIDEVKVAETLDINEDE